MSRLPADYRMGIGPGGLEIRKNASRLLGTRIALLVADKVCGTCHNKCPIAANGGICLEHEVQSFAHFWFT